MKPVGDEWPQPAIRRLTVVVSAVALAVALIFTLVVIGGAARPCASCHDGKSFVAGTRGSPHAELRCTQCHRASGALGEAVSVVRQPLHGLLPWPREADPDLAAVPDSRCRSCHEEVLDRMVVSKGLAIDHASCATASCTDCHSTVGHGKAIAWARNYDMEGCLECHVAAEMVGCDLCHQQKDAAARLKSSTVFTVTHGPQWRSTHGMGDTTTCSVCHGERDCVECHGMGVPHGAAFIEEHASFATSADQRCESCHADSFCASCHGMEMPHPKGFVTTHSTVAKTRSALCERCHEESDCKRCHELHIHPGGVFDVVAPEGGQR